MANMIYKQSTFSTSIISNNNGGYIEGEESSKNNPFEQSFKKKRSPEKMISSERT